MKALVLGGSGLIGNAIVRELVGRGYHVTALGRRPAPAPNLADLEVEYLRADLDTDVPLRDLLSTQEIVVDAAAPYPLHLFAGTVQRVRPESAILRTERLLEALNGLDIRFAYISTAIARRPAAPRGFLDLQSAFVRRVHPYFAIKEAIEDRVFEAAAKGLQATIVRPTVCLGPWDVKPRELCWMPALIEGRITVTPQQRLNVIDTRDLATSVVTALEHEHESSPITVSGHNTTVGALFALVCEAAATAPPVWRIPANFSVLPSLWTEFAWAAVGRASPLPSLVPMLLSEQDWVHQTAEHAGAEVPRRGLKETIGDAVSWYRRIGYC